LRFGQLEEKPVLTVMRTMASFLIILVGGYLVILLLATVFQRHLIYFPSRAGEEELLERARESDRRPWRNRSGEIIGWRNAESRNEAKGRILILQGNAGFALDRTLYVQALEGIDAGRAWEVILFEYPGYGARTGRTSETVFRAAVSEAIERLMAEDSRPIFILGESLGSGPACAAAFDTGSVAGLILVTPFNSLVDAAAAHYPWLPVRWLIRDRYDNIKALEDFDGPVVLLLAGQDEVVPNRLGRKLHKSLKAPSLLLEQTDAGHNTLDLTPSANWWREASDFLIDRPESEG
jgi:pimeloyl-ACP methyl ester carboxylesterase